MFEELSQSVFGPNGSWMVQYAVIFIVILTVLSVSALIVRRALRRRNVDANRPGQRGRQPRLGVVDIYELDPQRNLILLRRDNVEHLLLVGGPNDVVIERNIERAASGASAGKAEAPPVRQEPSAAVPGGGSTLGEAAAAAGFPMPALRASRAPAPTLRSVEPVIPKDGAARPSDEIIPGSRPSDTVPPPVRQFPPLPAKPLSVVTSKPEEAKPAAPVATDVKGDEAATTEPGERKVDPGILSDMTRQLEAALSLGPSKEGETNKPTTPETPEPHPVQVSLAKAERPADPSSSEPKPVVPTDAADVPAEPPSPAPEGEKPAEGPVLGPKETVASQDTGKTTGARAAVASKSSQEPFSVEDIEAEFARLLGRPLKTDG